MAKTYEPIATSTVASSGVTGTITFSSISSAYTDLRVILVGKLATNNTPTVRLNSDTGTNYSYSFLRANGTTFTNNASTNATQIPIGQGSWNQQPMLSSVDIFSYAGSTYKTFLAQSSEDYNTAGLITNTVGLWRSTSAITSISVIAPADTFNAGTVATLYGIKAA